MISGPVALALAAGMVATFNPCGFSLLPAYLGVFVAGDQVHDRIDQRIWRAVGVAAAVSVGFIVVFASAGLVIGSISGQARRLFPWITIVVGALLVIAGIATVVGWKPTLRLRGPQRPISSSSPTAMVGYGITYAIASLSCTIGPFLAVTGAAVSQSPLAALGAYIAYALGMGIIIGILSVAAALAHSTVTSHLRPLSRLAPRIGGALMILAGAYAVWYGRWELAVYGGQLETDSIIDTMERARLWMVGVVETVGAQRLVTLAAAALLLLVAAGPALSALRNTEPS